MDLIYIVREQICLFNYLLSCLNPFLDREENQVCPAINNIIYSIKLPIRRSSSVGDDEMFVLMRKFMPAVSAINVTYI